MVRLAQCKPATYQRDLKLDHVQGLAEDLKHPGTDFSDDHPLIVVAPDGIDLLCAVAGGLKNVVLVDLPNSKVWELGDGNHRKEAALLAKGESATWPADVWDPCK